LFAKEEFEPDTPNRFFFYRSRDCDDYCFNDAVIPGVIISSFGRDIILQATDIDVALLYLIGVMSIGVYGIMIGGWASNNKFHVGAVRAASQMILRGSHGTFIDSLIDDDRNLKFEKSQRNSLE
jgi:NADH-quinone oxidoreductase subunit H